MAENTQDAQQDQDQDIEVEDSIVNKIIPTTYRKKRRIHKFRKLTSKVALHENANNEIYQQLQEYHHEYKNNSVHTTKYTILSFLPKNLFEQFHRFANVYFVFIVLLNFIPQISAIAPLLSMSPVITILCIQAIKDIIEDYGRYKSDKEVNNAKTHVYKRSDEKFHLQKWKEVEVGDIIRLYCNDVIPADILLLHSSSDNGDCFIETMNIDGETNLKQRSVVKGLGENFTGKDFMSIITCERPNSEIYKFHGNITHPSGQKNSVSKDNLLLRGCVIRNTDFIDGIVVYAGHETKAMLNNNGPRYKRSQLEIRMNKDVVWCVVLLIILCSIGAIGNSIWKANMAQMPQSVLFIPPNADGETVSPGLSGFFMFWTMVILLQVLIPISLYVSIELVKVAQVFFINRDLDMYHEETDKPLQCRALNITEDLGQVQYVFSDKTGTLTENSMIFHRCTVGGTDYPHAANAERIESKEKSPEYLNPRNAEEPAKIFHQEANEIKRNGTTTTTANDKTEASVKRPQSAITRGSEKRQSYRRPASSTMRPHHRRNPSAMSTGFMDDLEKNGENPQTPSMKRNVHPRTSSRRPPHKYHRRNISSVSARGALASLAPDGREVILNAAEGHNTDEDDLEDLESDVTPDPVLLQQLVSSCSYHPHQNLPHDARRTLDFFINLAICNTVVLSTDNPEPDISLKRASTDMSPMVEQKTFLPSVPSLGKFFKKQHPTKQDKFRSLVDDNESSMTTVDGIMTANTNNGIFRSVALQGDNDVVFSKEYLKNIRYEAESPDEAALVYAANAYGVALAHRGNQTVTVTLPKTDRTLTYEVLHTLPFDSTRKRMSVVVRDPHSKQIILFCKGADSAILNILRNYKKDIPPDDGDSGMGSDYSCSTTSSHHESNNPSSVKKTKKHLTKYAESGLRTLCIAKRILTQEEYSVWLKQHEKAEQAIERREERLHESFLNIEQELELLGATGIEDRLQDGVPETIEALRNAGLQVWVITGDKQETAINISYSCRLMNPDDEVIVLNAKSEEDFQNSLDGHLAQQERVRGALAEIPPDPNQSFISTFTMRSNNTLDNLQSQAQDGHKPLGLVIDGKTLEYALLPKYEKSFVELARRCRSVLCCRATPLQKGNIVKLIRDTLHVMTLAIGDGANDVSMIQVANIGIGISGQEGMQAVMSSDFAMARFRYLQKLLLVHGHWCYQRLAAMVLYFFYKNAAFIFLIFFYQIFCGFSGSNPIEQFYLLFFSLIFTSVPPLVTGALDQDIPLTTLLRKPYLYQQGLQCEMYTPRSFWINILDAFYQSCAMFFIPYGAYYDSDVGVIEWGTPVTTACLFAVLIHLGIETKSWTWIHWVWQIFSVGSFFLFSLVYNQLCPSCGQPSSPYYVTQHLCTTATFWFSVILATIVALLPRIMVRTLQSHYWPTESQTERILSLTKKSSSSVPTTSETSATSSTTHHNTTYDDAQEAAYVNISKNNNGDVRSFENNSFVGDNDGLKMVSPHQDNDDLYTYVMEEQDGGRIFRDDHNEAGPSLRSSTTDPHHHGILKKNLTPVELVHNPSVHVNFSGDRSSMTDDTVA